MKRLTLIVMAGLLMLGLTQCKKEQTNTNTNANAEGEWVTITVKVDAGDRHIVYPGTGAVVYSNGDKIYVGNNGHYVGTLTYNDGAFSGQIQSPSTADYLHFYFIGGEYTGTLNAGTTESFDWSIADQSEKLPVLSYGHSTQKYTDGNATYSCTLDNQCALVEFSLTHETSDAVTVGGMLTTATINFGTSPGITPVIGTTGTITLYPESTTSKWAILLPKDSDTETTATIGGNSYDVTVPAVAANGYVHGTGNAVDIDTNPYYFSVDVNKTVKFSPGNLQYNGTTKEWRFAPNQWEVCQKENGTWDTEDWVDLFQRGAWTTGGNDPLEVIYSNSEDDFPMGNNDLRSPLINNAHTDWFTLSVDEWDYLFNRRDNASTLYGMANVNEVQGIIILPDGSELTINTDHDDYNNNTFSKTTWSAMEAAGAVFLPAAGKRPEDYIIAIGDGFYWSSDFIDCQEEGMGYSPSILFFRSDELGLTENCDDVIDIELSTDEAYSVRLVR